MDSMFTPPAILDWAGKARWATPGVFPQTPEKEIQKLRRAARDFESILLAKWWEGMQQGFVGSSEGEQTPGAANLKGLAAQAMCQAVAAAGGLGLAELMVHQLAPALGLKEAGPAHQNGEMKVEYR